MKAFVKKVVRWTLRLLCTPLRRSYRKRNGVVDHKDVHELPNETFLALVNDLLAQGKSVTIWGKGYSMRPFIEHERDRVKLKRMEEVRVGDAVLAQPRKGWFVLHRIIAIEGDHITLQGDGNIYGTEHCLRNQICGTAIEYIRPSRTILTSDPALCRRIRLWRRLRPVRRYLLFIYKCICI